VGVSNHDTVADGKGYVDSLDVPYPMAHAPEVWEQYGVPYQPATVVISSAGEIATRVEGPITLEGLQQVIEQQL